MAELDEFGLPYITDVHFDEDFHPTANRDMVRVSGSANLESRLTRLLNQEINSYTYRSGKGVGIRQFQNLSNSYANREKIRGRIISQFEADPMVNRVKEIRFQTIGNQVKIHITTISNSFGIITTEASI